MPDYQKGKIYAIKSYQTEMIYIGSTIQPLSKRLGEHRTNYKKNGVISSKEILKYQDYYIELIENFPCNTKEELLKREGFHIKENQNNCVNCRIAGRTPQEYNKDNIEKRKQYYQDNAEKVKEQKKQYRQNNVEKLKETKKQYYQDHVDKIKETSRQYRQDNADKIKQYRQDNVEKSKQYQKQYYQDNVEKKKQYIQDNADKIKQYNKQRYLSKKKQQQTQPEPEPTPELNN